MRTPVLCVALAIVFLSSIASAQWVQTNGPYGATVNSLAVSGTNLFAGTWGGGVFLSTNNGTSWTAVNAGLANTNVQALAVSGTNLFAGTYDGVFLSANNGTSWTAVNSGLTNTNVQAFAVRGTNLFAGTLNGGVYLSTNNGTSWSAVNSGLTNTNVSALAVSGSNLFAGTYGGVFLSTNNGLNWTAVNNGLTDTLVSALAVSGTNLFAGTNYGGVFLSTNNGTSWTASNEGLPKNTFDTTRYERVGCLAVSGTNLFASTGGSYSNDGGGVYLSTDNGTSWTSANTPFPGFNEMASLGGNLFAGTGSGVFLSTNNGTSWTAMSDGLTNIDVRALAVSGTNLFAGTSKGVYRTTDNGNMWTIETTGMGNQEVFAIAVSGTNLFAGAGHYSYFPHGFWGYAGGVYRSTDDGTTWEITSLTGGFYGISLAVSGSHLLAGMECYQLEPDLYGIYRSADHGANWDQRSGEYINCLASAISGTNVFAGTQSAGVLVSTNNGTSWTAVNTGLPDYSSVSALAISGTDLFAGTLDPWGWSGGVFLSTNNGTSWTSANTPFSGFNQMVSLGGNLFAGTGGGVYLSTNNGTSWTEVNTGLPVYTTSVSALTVSGTNLFAGTGGGGVWRRPLSELVSVQLAPELLPTEYNLEQNYPNPFNPTTTIGYAVGGTRNQASGAREVRLSVYDILGREVAVLVNERKAPGNYEAKFDASGLASGLYCYRLTAGTFVQTRKMMLVR